ncbi:MAG: c-type cytochrome [Pontiellaceae bacterium]|nr:c-type cytochrome [Pontiellaceae bacterium]
MKYKSIAFLTVCLSSLAMISRAEDEVSLSKDLMPLFQRSCQSCHQRENGNRNAVKSGYFYENKDDVLRSIGKIIIKNEPKKSHLVYLITPPKDPNQKKQMMPPTRSKAPKLTKEEIRKITEWIKAGAKDN